MRLNEKFTKWSDALSQAGLTTDNYYGLFGTSYSLTSSADISRYCPSLASTLFNKDEVNAFDIYLHSTYGERILMPWVESASMVTYSTQPSITSAQQNVNKNVMRMVLMRYGSKWDRLLSYFGTLAMIDEDDLYDPTKDYSLHSEKSIDEDTTVEMKGTISQLANGTRQIEKSGTEITSRDGTMTVTDTGKEKDTTTYPSGNDAFTVTHKGDTIVSSIKGFNSTGFEEVSKVVTSDSGSGDPKDVTSGTYNTEKEFTNRKRETDFDNYLEKTDYGTTGTGGTARKDTETFTDYGTKTKLGADSDPRKDETARDVSEETDVTGKITGNTIQSLLREEWELRKYDIFKEMCEDIMRVIALPIY